MDCTLRVKGRWGSKRDPVEILFIGKAAEALLECSRKRVVREEIFTACLPSVK